MNHEFMLGGVLISTIVPATAAALVLTVLLSAVLVRLRFYRLVWHRSLVDLAIFCVLLAGMVQLIGRGMAIG
ncbi:MAG: DUF1656 domain-containing protein [Caulobacteraceae bacterium]